MDELQHVIASNLKKIRLQKNLSFDQTAERTGVSKSMLSQIEKEKSNPTISTLWKIATGLQISFSSFMKKEYTEIQKVEIQRLNPAVDDQNRYLVYSLFSFHPEKKFEIYLVHLKPNSVHHAEAHAGEEYLLMSAGEMDLSILDHSYHLQSGDALHFTSNAAHIYQNAANTEAVFFDLIYYPD
ncbi:MAG: helix-turn-helix domain-containing protein [Sporolactobacillus sp.]